MATDWYVHNEGSEVVGPASTERLVEGIRRGRVPLTSRVCPVGGTEWLALHEQQEFVQAVHDVAAPPPSLASSAPTYSLPAQPAPAEPPMDLRHPEAPRQSGRPTRAVTTVCVYVPDSPHPPAMMTLAHLRIGLLQGRVPLTAVVQIESNGAWLPAQHVVAACIDFQPTRASGVIALMAVVPLAVLIGHIVIFGSAGVIGPITLLLAGFVGMAVVGSTASLRTRTNVALLRMPAFSSVSVLMVLACEAPAVVVSMLDRPSHQFAPFDAAVVPLEPGDALPKQTDLAAADFENLLRLKATADGTEPYLKAMLGTGPMLALGTHVRVVGEGQAKYESLFINYSEIDVLAGPASGKHVFIASNNLGRLIDYGDSPTARVSPATAGVDTSAASSSTRPATATTQGSGGSGNDAVRKAIENQNNCRARLSAQVALCKVGCQDRFSTLDPGRGRDEQVEKCESQCYDDPSLPNCN